MSAEPTTLEIDCHGDRLVGVLHAGAHGASLALVIVVGGGQYRVGAHRQFVTLARAVAERGVPVLRFDVRGMGDSEGEARHFLELEDDLRAAIDALDSRLSLDGVLLWGLCDGATASALYATGDARVKGLVLVNPWISTEAGVARTFLRHHYKSRLVDRTFWTRLGQGHVDVPASLRSVSALLWRLAVNRRLHPGGDNNRERSADLPQTVFRALDAFRGHVLTVIGLDDLTAREFDDALGQRILSAHALDPDRFLLERVAADHTFSAPAAQRTLIELTCTWLDRMTG